MTVFSWNVMLVVVLIGSLDRAASSCVWRHSGWIAQVPSGCLPLSHAVAVHSSDCVKTGGFLGETPWSSHMNAKDQLDEL